MLMNLLLRNYLHYNLYDQVCGITSLEARTRIPESFQERVFTSIVSKG